MSNFDDVKEFMRINNFDERLKDEWEKVYFIFAEDFFMEEED